MAKVKKAPKQKTKTVKGQSVPIPNTREEAAKLLARLGELQSDVSAIQADVNRRVQQIADEAEKRGGPLVSESEAVMKALEAFVEVHQAELMPDGRKSFSLTNGTVGVRNNPPRVNIRNTEEVLKHIKELDLPFIRTVEEIDKEAMLANPAKARSIDGVSISQSETFYVTLPSDGSELTKGFKLKLPKADSS